MAIETREQLEQYIALVERERDNRPAEAALVDEIKRLRGERAESLLQHDWADEWDSLPEAPEIVSKDETMRSPDDLSDTERIYLDALAQVGAHPDTTKAAEQAMGLAPPRRRRWWWKLW